jgi:hypothetical protein
MILAHSNPSINLPEASTCVIKTKGVLRNGDMVDIVSPLFSSIRYVSGPVNISETLSVPLRSNKTVKGTGKLKGILHCYDGSIFDMYVEI